MDPNREAEGSNICSYNSFKKYIVFENELNVCASIMGCIYNFLKTFISQLPQACVCKANDGIAVFASLFVSFIYVP